MSAREPAAGMVVAGRFRLEKILGQGGMGSVWLATHLGLEVPVAVKFMLAGASAEAQMRFHREAKAAAQIRSSNVVQILDYGIDEGMPFIAMELLRGEDLRARLRRVRRLSPAEALQILVPVVRGLERAHEAGLVHRDLKPENIFLTREGDVEIPKILDFGIAKALRPEGDAVDDAATREGAILGTPYYMSPEQARGRTHVDHRSDLWSLGVILFQLLTGKRPFPGKVVGDLVMQICADPIPLPSSILPGLSPEMDAFFARAMARDPAERFQSARELARAFAEVTGPVVGDGAPMSAPNRLPGEAVSVPPPTGPGGNLSLTPQRAPAIVTAPPIPPPREVAASTLGPSSQTFGGVKATSGSRHRRIAVGAAALLASAGVGALAVFGLRPVPPAGAAAGPTAPPAVTAAATAAPVESAAPSAAPAADPVATASAAATTTAARAPAGGRRPPPRRAEPAKPTRDMGY
jgi:serine/threonine-protein kinase